MSRDRMVLLATALLTALLAGAFTWYISSLPTHRPDFAMMWKAMQLSNPYDRTALNAALNWESKFPVAFVYPPTAMPIFELLGLLPMRVALTLWAVVSALAMALASRSKWTALLLITPAVLWAIPGGQTSVLQGSILLGAVLLMQRPVAAGLLFGIALCLKPQLALAFPLLLAINRRWDVVLTTIATVAGITILSAAIFGAHQWLEWTKSLPAFLNLHESMRLLQRNEIAPGFPVWARALALLVGSWAAATALRRGNRVEAFVIAVGTGLLSSAHAMGYEFAMFAAAAPALLARRGWSSSAIFLFLLTPGLIWFGLPPWPFRLLALLLLVTAAVVDGVLNDWSNANLQASKKSKATATA